MSTAIYVVLTEDQTAINWYYGPWDPLSSPYGPVITVQSSDQIYHDFYEKMVGWGMAAGMVLPD